MVGLISSHHNLSVMKQLGVREPGIRLRATLQEPASGEPECWGGQAIVLNKALLLRCDTNREVHVTVVGISKWLLDEGSSVRTQAFSPSFPPPVPLPSALSLL